MPASARYAARDSRIRVYENRVFLDAFSNCNVAVRQASAESKYCKVVSGDDWIFTGRFVPLSVVRV